LPPSMSAELHFEPLGSRMFSNAFNNKSLFTPTLSRPHLHPSLFSYCAAEYIVDRPFLPRLSPSSLRRAGLLPSLPLRRNFRFFFFSPHTKFMSLLKAPVALSPPFLGPAVRGPFAVSIFYTTRAFLSIFCLLIRVRLSLPL